MSNRNQSYNDKVELNDKSTVNGYIRKVENKSFRNHSFYRTIPMVINYLCMKFYHESKDRFHPELHGSNIIATDTIITKTKRGASSAFLSNIVTKGKHHWRFKIHRTLDQTLTIGIWNNKYNLQQVFNKYLRAVQDALYSINFGNGKTEGQNKQIVKYEYLVDGNGIIDMYLDLDTLDLSFSIDNINFGTVYKIKKGASYRACACIHSAQAELELIMYKPNIH